MADSALYQFKADLNGYTERQQRYEAATGVWSIGQMDDHIIAVALEYADEIERCPASTESQPLVRSPNLDVKALHGGFTTSSRCIPGIICGNRPT